MIQSVFCLAINSISFEPKSRIVIFLLNRPDAIFIRNKFEFS